MAQITIPYAVADFIDLRERKFYYVDCSAALGSGSIRRKSIIVI